MACATIERGRIVAMGDLGWLSDTLLAVENNKTLATNTFRWLAAKNIIDIDEIIIPETVKLGQTTSVKLRIKMGS